MNKKKQGHLPYSMTGIGIAEADYMGSKLRLEIKTLNHRFLDVKLKIPREFQSADFQIRTLIQSRLSRGSVEIKLEKLSNESQGIQTSKVTPNLAVAATYYEALLSIQKMFGLTEPIRATELAHFPEVLLKSQSEMQSSEAWQILEPLFESAIQSLIKHRTQEGQRLASLLLQSAGQIKDLFGHIKKRKTELTQHILLKTKNKVRALFELYPIDGAPIQNILESRLSQEIALLLDKTDTEEEITRFEGHLEMLIRSLSDGNQEDSLGKKLEFTLQELGREINTLGNKAADLEISGDVVQIKVKLEQIREQVLNLE